MITLSTPPSQFLNYNQMSSKQLNVVVDIDGLPLFSAFQINRYIEYGDVGLNYGGAGLVFGGTVPIGFNVSGGERQQKNLLMLDGGNFTISQRLEPEQGRGSISTLTMSFVDKDSYMTQVVSPGIIVDEILGRQVKIWIGYGPTSWPQDYFVVWRGRVGQVMADIGKVTLQFLDPNVIRKQQIFYCGQSTLVSDINNSTGTIPFPTANFFEKIMGPAGNYDGAVRCFIKIDDEFMEYQQAGFESTGFDPGGQQLNSVSRGVSPVPNMATPSAAAAHSAGATVDGYIMLTDHAMAMALKIMLSGWNGPYLPSQSIYSFVNTDDSLTGNISNAIVLPVNVDAIRDLGITPGDYITITGSSHGGNNVTCIVTGFDDMTNQPNRVVLTSVTFTAEDPSSAMIAVRSQYDVLPTGAGCQLPGWEVDIGQFQYLGSTFLQDTSNQYQFLINGTGEAGKTFIESEILLPLGAYSLTRQGKISVGLTKPPIADQRTQILTRDNVLEPSSIQIQRGVNNRKFFNEIDWSFDCDETNTPTSQRNTIDSGSLSLIGISSVLPIASRGARTDLGFLNVVANRENWIFNRYKTGSNLIDLKTNLQIGNQVEVGDILIIQDNGGLQIPNFTTGIRDFGTQYAEVINRSLDLKTGIVSLTLETGTGATTMDRYATVAPSSLLDVGSTSTKLVVKDSFGAIFPGNEQKKWTSYVGLKVRVHSPDFLKDGTSTLMGFDSINPKALIISPALSFSPTPNYIVDLAQYPTNATVSDQALAKLIHAFTDPSVAVVTGISHTSFTVSGGDATKFHTGLPVILHDQPYRVLSPEAKVVSVIGTTIIVDTDLGFVPNTTIKIELIGFADSGQPYRFV